MRIGRLEITWNKSIAPSGNPNRWTLKQSKRLARHILSELGEEASKVKRIKYLREITPDYDNLSHPKWGLREQKEWVEKYLPVTVTFE